MEQDFEILTPFNKLQGTELKVMRKGIFCPSYTLTDDMYTYGKISYSGFWYKTTYLTTATDSWTIRIKGIFTRTLLIFNAKGENIGSIVPRTWSRKIDLKMDSGFGAEFLNKKLISYSHTWLNEQYGDLVSIKANVWGFKNPFKVIFDPGLLRTVPEIPFLSLLGINLVLMKQAQAAAAAGA